LAIVNIVGYSDDSYRVRIVARQSKSGPRIGRFLERIGTCFKKLSGHQSGDLTKCNLNILILIYQNT
jgi:hypothetical protein